MILEYQELFKKESTQQTHPLSDCGAWNVLDVVFDVEIPRDDPGLFLQTEVHHQRPTHAHLRNCKVRT